MALSERYAEHGLETPAHRIFSEASVGKAYLKGMGIKSLLECQPNFTREMLGKSMCTYYGGRAEVHIRRWHCQTNWPGAEEAIIEDSQGAS